MIRRDVTIEREGRFWLIRIDGTNGLTQARSYAEVELMAREYVALVEDVDMADVEIGSVTVAGVSDRLATAARERGQARELEAAANRAIRDVARDLRADGAPLADIGAIIGVSHQRAHQLLAA